MLIDPNIMNIEQFRSNIHQERKKKKISVAELCKKIGRDRYYISQMTNPNLNTIIDIAYSIGCSCADLMRDE